MSKDGKILYSGHDLLPKDSFQSGHFGNLSAWSTPQKKGRAKIMLNKSEVKISESDLDVIIELPETHARELAEKLRDALIRLEHLRNLSRMDKLNPNAYHEEHDNPDL